MISNERIHRLTELLGIDLPIVQASMSWLTNAELVAAVSQVGGLGYIPSQERKRYQYDKR